MPFRILKVAIFLVFYAQGVAAQTLDDSIRQRDAEDILGYLASDKLKGRVNFTKEQREAAEFISGKFKEWKLENFPGLSNYYHPFQPYPARAKYFDRLTWNNKSLADTAFVFMPHSLVSKSLGIDDFIILRAELPLPDSILFNNWNDSVNVLFWIPNDTNVFAATDNVILPGNMPKSDIMIVASSEEPVRIDFKENKNYGDHILHNVIGMLPGKSKPEEVIVFSAHYDHVDKDVTGKKTGIFNGANDDASGTTAVMLLARYYALRNDNERTIIFCLFAGEELGLLGSRAFVNEINIYAIKAVINIEMIGSHSASGKNAYFITGSAYSDLIDILRKNTSMENFIIKDEIANQRQLYQRSDNYSFVLRGAVAHTVMSSDDKDPCYHKTCDEVKWIDFKNMTSIIRAIAKGCQSLIAGLDTPQLKQAVSSGK